MWTSCDRCCAQAVGFTTHDAGPLYWCGHHLRKHGEVLADLVLYRLGTEILDLPVNLVSEPAPA